MQIGMEPLVIDWAKEEPARRTRDGANNSAYLCLLRIIQFLSRLCNIFSHISSAEGVLPNDEFRKKIILPFQKPLKMKN